MTESLGTHSQDAAGRQEAARELLQRPIITAGREPDLLTLIRKHATALKAMFDEQLGYTLVVESSFARLEKTPLEENSPTRALRRPNGIPLGASSYVVLSLACAALLAPGVGDQVLMSALIAQMRDDADERSIALSDYIADRRRIVAALQVLVEWGVLSETDGTVQSFVDSSANEALLTVSRALLPHLLSNSLGPRADPQTVIRAATDTPRRRLRRRLVEDPITLRRDMSEDELDVLSRERVDLTRQLDEHFGLTLEVRAEGALAYDAEGKLSDIEFPGSGSLNQAALLLLGELIERLPEPPARTPLRAPWTLVDETLRELTTDRARSWKAEYVNSVEQLRTDVVRLLRDLRLAEPSDDALLVHAHAARYRPTTGAGA